MLLRRQAVSAFRKIRRIDLSSQCGEIMKNLYVGNMDQATTEQDLKAAFTTYGPVDVVTIIKDQTTGVPRGFGFVEMAEDKDALQAVQGLNGSVIAGRTITVSEARPKPKNVRSPR